MGFFIDVVNSMSSHHKRRHQNPQHHACHRFIPDYYPMEHHRSVKQPPYCWHRNQHDYFLWCLHEESVSSRNIYWWPQISRNDCCIALKLGNFETCKLPNSMTTSVHDGNFGNHFENIINWFADYCRI